MSNESLNKTFICCGKILEKKDKTRDLLLRNKNMQKLWCFLNGK